MAKLGQIKSGTMRVGNTTASGYGIVYADEVIGHRRVNTYTDLANIPDWCLYNKAGGETTNAAIGQLWYVTTGDTSGHSAGLYQLTGWSNNTKTWTFFKNGANVSTHDTTYTFANGNGSFTVTPKGGTAQTVSIGKPATAGTADHAKTADSATKADSATSATNATNATNAGHATSADSATSATKATQDKNGRDIVDTYATKSQVSALSSALVYRGTVDAKYALPTKNVKVGDVYVVAAAGTFAGQTCEPGDMIIAQTASNAEGTPAPTWTVVQTNINGAVTAADTLGASKLIVGSGNKAIHAVGGTGFVKVESGTVVYDNNTYLTTTSASSTYATKTALDGKVDKVTGKGLSTNDFTAAYKTKLDDLGLSGNSFNDASTDTKGLTLNLVGTDSSYNIPIVKPSTDASTYGLMSGTDKKRLDNLQNYTLPVAAAGKLGGIELGYGETGRNYAVKLDSNKAYVHVPWTDTNTTYPLASESVNGLMSSSDKAKLNRIQYPTGILTPQLDLCGFKDYTALVNAVANQKDGLSFFVTDQNAIVTLQTDNGKHAIIQTIRTATELNNSWEFDTGATSSHKDGVLFTYQRFYPISGTYSTGTQNKWTKWAIIDVDTMYTDGRSSMNSIYKAKGKQLLNNLAADSNGKITFSSVYSGIDTTGIKSESKEILTPIPGATITGLF